MSKLSKAADKLKEVNSLRPEEIITNYMGGDSYVINPLDTLKMVSASSIFAEPSYYRSSKSSKASVYKVDPLVAEYSIIDHTYKGMTTDEEDYVEHLVNCSTHDYVLFFTNKGKVYRIKGYEIPEIGNG